MSLRYAKHLLPVLLFFVSTTASAQNASRENSPYSRYGIGELKSGNNTWLRGMGNATSAAASATAVNADNPASYASLRLTTYEAGAEAGYRSIKTSTQTYTTGTLTLSYLNVGIPLGKWGGMALGLRPQSRVFYHIADSNYTAGIGNTVNEYEGEGGLNYAFFGLAGKIKGFSLGLNFGYSFGTIQNSSKLNNIDTTEALNTEFIRNTKIGGIYYKLGAQYETKLNKKLNLRLGATASLKQDLHATRDDYSLAYHYINAGGTRVDDSAYVSTGLTSTVTMPLSYSFGAQLFGQKWGVAADVQQTQWSQFRNFGNVDSVADNATRISFGGEYTPNATSLYKYLQRVTYRAGIIYGTDYVRLRDTKLIYYALTLGASLPFKRSTDRLHLAFELGQRGTTVNNLVRENYFRFGLGISLNDRWFIKRKYE